MRRILIACLIIASENVFAQSQTDNLIIVTLDGFRWQELFMGADPNLLFSDRYTSNEEVRKKFWDPSSEQRREKLLPFFWKTIGTQGQLYGNRKLNNRVNCANPHWFSYPGYSEMLTGMVDRRVKSNDSIVNPNTTVMEFINKQERYHGKVASFSTWEVIPFIIRAQQADIEAKCKLDWPEEPDSLSNNLAHLMDQQFIESQPADEDFKTFYSAFEYLKTKEPKVLYISLDKTDEHAHAGDYDQYLRAAYATDQMLSELWNWIQSNEKYKDQTTLLIPTDHGRGRKPHRWKKHGRHIFGSGQLWFAVIGPDTPPKGEINVKAQYYQKQFAKTAASFLGLDYDNVKEVGGRIYGMTGTNNVATRD